MTKPYLLEDSNIYVLKTWDYGGQNTVDHFWDFLKLDFAHCYTSVVWLGGHFRLANSDRGISTKKRRPLTPRDAACR